MNLRILTPGKTVVRKLEVCTQATPQPTTVTAFKQANNSDAFIVHFEPSDSGSTEHTISIETLTGLDASKVYSQRSGTQYWVHAPNPITAAVDSWIGFYLPGRDINLTT